MAGTSRDRRNGQPNGQPGARSSARSRKAGSLAAGCGPPRPSRALTRPRTKPAASSTAPTVASGMLGPQPAAEGPARCVTLRGTAAWCTRLGVGDAWIDQQALDREMCACGHSHEATAAADEPPQPRRHAGATTSAKQLYKGSGNAFSRQAKATGNQNQPVKGEWQVHEGLRGDPG